MSKSECIYRETEERKRDGGREREKRGWYRMQSVLLVAASLEETKTFGACTSAFYFTVLQALPLLFSRHSQKPKGDIESGTIQSENK